MNNKQILEKYLDDQWFYEDDDASNVAEIVRFDESMIEDWKDYNLDNVEKSGIKVGDYHLFDGNGSSEVVRIVDGEVKQIWDLS